MSRYDRGAEDPAIGELRAAVESARSEVFRHPDYTRLEPLRDVVILTENHVFAVWDFASLLKNLQRHLTRGEVPRVPHDPIAGRRLVNDVVLVEESDGHGDGFISHFELYVMVVDQACAATRPVTGHPEGMVEDESAPPSSAAFVSETWDLVEHSPLHCQAATFTLGREDPIPEMCDQVIWSDNPSGQLAPFRDFLPRHIDVDDEQHPPMATAMVADLCGMKLSRWDDCARTMGEALQARLSLRDGVVAALDS